MMCASSTPRRASIRQGRSGKLGAAEYRSRPRGARARSRSTSGSCSCGTRRAWASKTAPSDRRADRGRGTAGALDGPSETRIAVETKDYQDLDHGYAATIHKSQGATVDRTYVLASQYFDRHASYVALSRHRGRPRCSFGAERSLPEGQGQGAPVDGAEAKLNFEAVRSPRTPERARPRLLGSSPSRSSGRRPRSRREPRLKPRRAGRSLLSVEALQARGRAAWAALRAENLKPGCPPRIFNGRRASAGRCIERGRRTRRRRRVEPKTEATGRMTTRAYNDCRSERQCAMTGMEKRIGPFPTHNPTVELRTACPLCHWKGHLSNGISGFNVLQSSATSNPLIRPSRGFESQHLPFMRRWSIFRPTDIC